MRAVAGGAWAVAKGSWAVARGVRVVGKGVFVQAGFLGGAARLCRVSQGVIISDAREHQLREEATFAASWCA